jgi:hypothetical protein
MAGLEEHVGSALDSPMRNFEVKVQHGFLKMTSWVAVPPISCRALKKIGSRST